VLPGLSSPPMVVRQTGLLFFCSYKDNTFFIVFASDCILLFCWLLCLSLQSIREKFLLLLNKTAKGLFDK